MNRHEDRLSALRAVVGDVRLGSDMGLPGTVDLSDAIARLRPTLDPDAVQTLRAVGAAATAAMAEAAAAVESGMTEHEAAAALAAACRSRGLTATVLLARRQRACDEILARMRDEATRPGRTLAEAFADCRCFYAEAGFPGEWRLHHQGGFTGYASRELIATAAVA
jgi:hypothetical protein